MRDIGRDERRGEGPQSARRRAVASGSPLGDQVKQSPGLFQPCPGDMAACFAVALLAGAPGPCCAPRLASGLPDAITVTQNGRNVL